MSRIKTPLLFVMWVAASLAWAQAPAAVPPPSSCIAEESKSVLAYSVLQPFWEDSKVGGETVLFQVGPGSSQPTARLLFQPTRILKITSADGKILFKAGRDYSLKDGTNIIELPPGSRIPSRTWAEMHPALSPATSLGQAVGGKTSLLFERFGGLFQSLQVAINYEHRQQWTGYIPTTARDSLRRTFALLQSGQPLKLVVLGDSISAGSGSSFDFHLPPCQPPYVELVADGLQQRYRSSIALRNLSVGGKTAAWGVEMAAHVSEEKPDLVLIAFGMNDAGGQRTAEAYSADVRKIIDTVRQSSPNADFILVATMSGNPEWLYASPTLYSQYREALRHLQGPGIAMADMTSVSEAILRTKTFADITANGVNHPNDFGHRIYAQTILAVLR